MFSVSFVLAIFILFLHQNLAQKRIVEGQPVKLGDYPMVGQILKHPNHEHKCGGVIFSKRNIITCASCFDKDENNQTIFDNRRIMVGDIQTREHKENLTSRQVLEIEAVFIHEKYVHDKIHYNIAVVRLKTDIKLSKNVAIGNLGKEKPKTGTNCTVCGWGWTEKEVYSDVLLTTSIFIQNSSQCSQKDYRPEHMICAGDAPEHGGVCKGDTGGPLICDGKISGLVLYGDSLCRRIAAFVDVTKFSNWINDKSLLGSSPRPSSSVRFKFDVFCMRSLIIVYLLLFY